MLLQTKIISVRERRIKRRSVACLLLLLILIALICVKRGLFALFHSIHRVITERINEAVTSLIYAMTAILIVMILYYIFIFLYNNAFFKHKDLRKSFNLYTLKKEIDRAFINAGVYNVVESISDNEKLAETPSVIIVDDFTIKIKNVAGLSEKIEKFKVHLSALLKNGFVCETYQIDMTNDYYIAKLIDLSSNNQKVITDYQDFIDYIKDTKVYQIKVMPNFMIDVAKTPHLLIAGATGSGKSYLLYLIIFQLILKECDIYLVDRKKVLTKFKSVVGLDKVADEKEKIFEVIQEVENVMDHRERFLEQEFAEEIDVDFTSTNFKPIFLVIDELGSFVSELDSKEQKKFNSMIQSIVQRGRASGVNIIISMQQPNAQNLPTAIRDQLSFKTVLGSTDNTTRTLVFTASDLSDINFSRGQGYYTCAGVQNKPAVLFVPTFEFSLDIDNLKALIKMNKQKTNRQE